MSAVAASAAAVPGSLRRGARRPALRAVPMEAGPVVALELGNPLQLTETMRTRLLAAVRALVSAPAMEGACDATRLAAVVLLAKARVTADYSTEITAAELGRWMGLKQSWIAHTVLPELRERGVVGSNETTSAAGRTTGLECWVIPMHRAQQAGDRRHVLALSRVELAVLLALIEVLFAPGWTCKDGRVIPAGMLADRTGRGSATDRLGLLLMVLSTNSKGWLQLCPGSVDTERGRPAATVGRLLGCSPSGGAKVLARLEERGTLTVDRRETASQMNARSRVRLLPVAQAHGLVVREAREAADAVFSDLAGTASGDLEGAAKAVAPGVTGVDDARKGENPDTADLAVTAHLHASHASGVTPGGSLSLSRGFSGEGRGENGDRPERACARENRAPDAAAADELRLVDGGGGPLRGEQREKSPVVEQGESAVPNARLNIVGGGRAQRQGRRALPDDLRLREVLEPVAGLWEQLSSWQQDQVQAAVAEELTRLAAVVLRPEMAPGLLASRLADRLEETGGEALVGSAYGWLIRRGLVQRPACVDVRCDDGIRLDTREDCPCCASVIADRRAVRARVRVETAAALAGAGTAELRAAYERRLRTCTVVEADRAQVRHALAASAAQERQVAVARRREREKEAERARQLAPCADCGLPEAAGLCPACSYARRTDVLVEEAVDLVVAARADLDDPQQVAELTARCEADTRALIAEACRRRGGDAAWAAYAAPEIAEQVHGERLAAAVRRLMASEDADAEADAAYETSLCRRPHDHRAAEATADEARRRTAEYLLRTRLGQLKVLRARLAAGRSHRWAA